MLAKARERGLYDALEAADIVDHLRRFGAAFDLIVAADALAYCGDLQPIFAAAAAAAARQEKGADAPGLAAVYAR
jgi:predicted TPR repeat methyltransferase